MIVAIFAGPKACAEYAGAIKLHRIRVQALQFCKGLYVLMAGVRLLLAELVPAFQGISMKLVPNSKPALDCPVLFPYAPNAVILDSSLQQSDLSLVCSPTPMLWITNDLTWKLSNFAGTAGIFANQVGGRRGTIIDVACTWYLHRELYFSPNAWKDWIPEHDTTDADTVVTGFFFMIIKISQESSRLRNKDHYRKLYRRDDQCFSCKKKKEKK